MFQWSLFLLVLAIWFGKDAFGKCSAGRAVVEVAIQATKIDIFEI